MRAKLEKLLAPSIKDNYFRIRNRGKADKTAL